MIEVIITAFWNLIKNFFSRMSPMKIILLGFVTLILAGTVLLSLPVSARSGESTPFLESCFTATSAVCVTGLVKFDTHNYWSLFGQGVILALIQVGGMGFMTICISAISVTKKKIGLNSREIMQSSISAPHIGGIVKMTRFVLLGTLTVELVGAALLAIDFCPRYGLAKGLWFSLFHSISAFCNAGFDLMGGEGDFSSLTGLSSDIYVCTVISILIILGGLGFFVWRDILDCRFKFSKFRLQTKTVIIMSVSLIFGGALILYLVEMKAAGGRAESVFAQAGGALFQSVSARTAGFNTINLAQMTHSGLFVMIILMIIGGSPGSTAGGMKTTTFAILLSSVVSTFKRRKSAEMLGRRLEESATRLAMCVFMLYILLSTSVAVVIATLEDVPFINALFESASAVATVGLTTGITPGLGAVSSVLLMLLMLFGRVGSLTMLFAISSFKSHPQSQKPLERIQIG